MLPACQQSLGVSFAVIGDPGVHFIGKTEYVRRYVVDKHGAVETNLVHVREELLRAAAELLDLLELGTLFLHKRERLGLEHLHGLDVNVTISDQHRLGIEHYLSEHLAALEVTMRICRFAERERLIDYRL